MQDRPGYLWLGTRVDVAAARRLVAASQPGLTITAVEVDGEPRALDALGWVSTIRHRVTFPFQGISLNTGAALTYRHRLRGLSDEWSRTSPAPEAQFPGLDAGQYVFEARVRRGNAGPWSPAAVTFGIATPIWRTWWFRTFALLALAYGLLRFRERSLRRTQFVLERIVRERTAELHQQKAHIEDINADLVIARDAAEAPALEALLPPTPPNPPRWPAPPTSSRARWPTSGYRCCTPSSTNWSAPPATRPGPTASRCSTPSTNS